MKYPKLVIISDGKRVAALLDGIFYGKGIGRFSMDATKRNAPEHENNNEARKRRNAE